MTKIKICGLLRPTDIDYVNQAGPDYAGFVFAAGSRRQVTLPQARALVAALDPQIQRVGVFRNEPLALIQKLFTAGVIQMAQIHRELNDPLVDKLKACGIPVIQAVVPTDSRRGRGDYTLLDNVIPGSGRPLDWARIARPKRPFFLAGGLTPDNVCQAIHQLHPTVVDVSSGVETAGRKDFQKIETMVRSVHNDQN